jgi:hypothetical protein
VALVDHSPSERRVEEIKKLAGLAKYIVVHDADPWHERQYHFSTIYPLFKYVYVFEGAEPYTAVLSNFVKYSVLGEGQKSSSARAVQIAQTYALKTFFSQAFFISEGWDEAEVEDKQMSTAQEFSIYKESPIHNSGITYHEFPTENLYLVDFVVKEVLESHSLSALMKVFNKYKNDFMKTDKETEFLNYFSVRKKELEALVNEPKE